MPSQAMYIEARSQNQSCRGRAKCITCSWSVCSLSYPAGNAHAPCCIFNQWSVWLYHTFPHYPINATVFEKKNVTEHEICVLNSYTTLVLNISHCMKNSVRYNHNSTYVVM